MTAISAQFVKLQPVQTRKVVQVILEAPEEQADAILSALGGYPKSDNPQWVGVAPLEAEAAQKPAEDRKGGKLAQRAGILCGEPAFQKYITDDQGYNGVDSDKKAAEWLRFVCCVDSRADLDHDAKGAAVFRDIERGYRDWMRS